MENSVEGKTYMNIESKILQLTIQLYLFYDEDEAPRSCNTTVYLSVCLIWYFSFLHNPSVNCFLIYFIWSLLISSIYNGITYILYTTLVVSVSIAEHIASDMSNYGPIKFPNWLVFIPLSAGCMYHIQSHNICFVSLWTEEHLQTIIASAQKVDNIIPTQVQVKPSWGAVRGWSN